MAKSPHNPDLDGPAAPEHGRGSEGADPKLEVQPPKYLSGDIIATKYRLTSLIGEGGMGAVWLAKNLTLDADVCVKLIRREVATPQASQRLLQEARAAARLSHACIVRVFDFGETEYRDPFIVMELLRGDSLRRLISRKARLPAANAVATLLPVAGGLAEAHSKGVVHRDLKPENIVLVSDEKGAVLPKIVDFGVAKLRHDDTARRLTQDGSVLGSPDYMSPEQAQGRKDIDERSDIWAFSVMLYEMLTGRLPFQGDNYNALLWAIQRQAPEPTTTFAAGDEALWKILARGLEKARDKRWDSMRAMGVALAEWAVTHGVDVDVTGNSIALGWLAGARRPLSEAPITALRTPSFADTEGDSPLTQLVENKDVRTEASDGQRRDPRVWRVAAGAIVVGIALGVALLSRDPTSPSDAAAPSAPQMATPSASPTPSAGATVAANAATSVASAETPNDAEAAAPEAAATHAGAPQLECVARLFPAGTFEDPASTSFDFLCSESDPRNGVEQLKAELVKSRGKGVSGGMQEWAKLSWYEMAVFAVARAHCCAQPKALVLPSTGDVCPPLSKALESLGSASASGGDTAAALEHFDQAVLCLFQKGGAARYRYSLVRLDAPRTIFQRTLQRARSAPKTGIYEAGAR